MEFFTIGVYNLTEEAFFEKLKANQIDVFCDIRQRRGVRGAKYSFVNSKRLQNRLKELNINYVYVPDLAPTSQIRELQKIVDKKNGELKSERKNLGDVFVKEYKSRILKNFDLNELISKFELVLAKRIVLFCVEELATACHRSLVAEELMKNHKVETIEDL